MEILERINHLSCLITSSALCDLSMVVDLARYCHVQSLDQIDALGGFGKVQSP